MAHQGACRRPFAAGRRQFRGRRGLARSQRERGLEPVDADEITKRGAALPLNKISEPIQLEGGGFAILKLLERQPAREKTFEEAGAEVSNSYQEYQSKSLEDKWLERVRRKYPVKAYKEQLKNAFSMPASKGPAASRDEQ